MKRVIVYILAVIAIVGSIGGLCYYYFEIRPVAVVLLKTDMDPFLNVRGRQIGFNYEITEIPFAMLKDAKPEEIKSGWSESDIYIELRKGKKYYHPHGAYKNKPTDAKKVWIWGRSNGVRNKAFYVRYNISSLAISKESAAEISKIKTKLLADAKRLNKPLKELMTIDVEISINYQGKAKIRRFFINDKPFLV
ncbi:hypothetical protein ACFL0T_08675 [Candidatus Omnitrophota bacterium]